MSTTGTDFSQGIHRQMTIEEILSLFPNKTQRLAQEITNAGLHCVGCHAATWETLEEGMIGHGMPEESISKLVTRLNALLEEESDLATITVTKRAAEKFLEALDESEKKEGSGLRFAGKKVGCKGFEYLLDYSEKASEDDAVFKSQGIEIHVNQAMLNRLLGSEIDYIDGVEDSGFKIHNPNAPTSCGCSGNSR